MALTMIGTRFRCTECSRVVFAVEPRRCCGFTMLPEQDAARK